MYRKYWAVLLAIIVALVSALPALPAMAAEDAALTIRGDGVEKEMSFTLAELKAMSGYISQNAYSTWNTWPVKSTYFAQGVALAELLKRAGMKDTAMTVNIAEEPAANDSAGYNMTFLLDDILAERYTFEDGKITVPTILAFRQSEKSLTTMEDTDLRLIYGQLDEQEQTSVGFVKNVSIITVSCTAPPQLPMPEAKAEKLPDGRYEVTLTTSNANAKIYYTTDGSAPSVHSKMYNISAPRWQPQLNVPFTVSGSAKVRAIAVAMGFNDSQVLEFVAEPPPEKPVTLPAPSPGANGADGIKVVIDGKAMSFDVPPQNVNGRILVPLRTIFEEMGAAIDYDGATRTVKATKGDTTVVLTIGDASPTVNGKVVPLDQPGVIVDGRTLAPLRFVAEAFGGTVDWVAAENTAYIAK
jgi:hypothetical protein